MNEAEDRIIAAFSTFLVRLPDDARAVLMVINDESVQSSVKRPLAGAINYLFKSLDLIDDGVEGLGYLDDALILRWACAEASQASALPTSLAPLIADTEAIVSFLGALQGRFERYVADLGETVVRGRSVDAILTDPTVRQELTGDVVAWTARYKAPAFVLNELGLVKLRSFLSAKLPP